MKVRSKLKGIKENPKRFWKARTKKVCDNLYQHPTMHQEIAHYLIFPQLTAPAVQFQMKRHAPIYKYKRNHWTSAVVTIDIKKL